MGSSLLAVSASGAILTGCESKKTAGLPLHRVKNWIWINTEKGKDANHYKNYFKLLKQNGITGVLFENDSPLHFSLAKEAGLEAHRWKWTLNRGEEFIMKNHPEWYVVNRNGDSSFDKPAYVPHYKFTCPNREDLVNYLLDDYEKEARKDYIDGVHLDYVRFPDVILPVGLWDKYGIVQTSEMPEYDYCYCDVCREKYKALKGIDPKDLKYPQATPSWISFRHNSVTNLVQRLKERVHSCSKPITAAVFPGPFLARTIVRQDWGNWDLDAFFPMIYNEFYNEDISWIKEATAEGVNAAQNIPIYSGLFIPNIKEKLAEAVNYAFEGGASGISFFSEPDEEFLTAFSDYLGKQNIHVG